MSRSTLALFALSLLACASPARERVVRDDPPASAPEPEREARSADAPCAESVECSFCSYFAPADPSECRCPSCDATAMTLTRCGAIVAEYERVCGAWAREHPCPPLACPDPHLLSICADGECVAAPVTEEGPSPCRTRGDCPGRLRCVTASLGGMYGCTNELCCGAAECGNGCATDADCDPCRPLCRDGSCRTR